MAKYYVTYHVDASYTAEVEAGSIKEALAKADRDFSEADFGEAEDIDGSAKTVEDEGGNYVWEEGTWIPPEEEEYEYKEWQ